MPTEQLPPGEQPPDLPESTPQERLPLFPGFPSWSWLDFLGISFLTGLAILACGLCVVMTASMILSSHGKKLAESANFGLLGVLAQAIGYVVMLLYIAHVLRQRSGKTAGEALHWNARAAAMGTGAVGGLLLAFANIWLQGQLPVPKQLPVTELFKGTWSAYGFAIFAVLLAPLFEEVYFRGLLFPLLRKLMGRLGAILLTSLFFALIHGIQLAFSWSALALVFFVGLVLTIVRARLGSVAASWTVHVTYNTTLMVITWLGTEHFRRLSR